jgi:hypothetical protein
MKDVVKTLNQRFSEPTLTTPLPEDLERVLGLFVVSHPHLDDSESQKLHDELSNVFTKDVGNSSEKHAAFLSTLRILCPVLQGEHRLDEWWALVIRPTIDSIGHKRDTIEDAREFLLGVMDFSQADDVTGERAIQSRHFLSRLLDAYFERTRIPTSPEAEFIAHELEGILLAFGRRKPKV